MDLTHTQEEREAEGDFRIFTLGRKMGLHKSMLGYAKGLYGYYLLWVGRGGVVGTLGPDAILL